MEKRRIIAGALGVAVLLAALAQTALAGSQTIDGISFKGPGDHQQCVNAATSDTITISGVTGHKPAASIQGDVTVSYILNNGANRQTFHTYHVSQSRNLSLRVNYPPVSQWPLNNPNTREIHVDVAIQVLVGGKVVGEFDGNPNLGWDLFCTTTVISPTATRTRQPGVTQTVTPRATQTFTPSAGVTATSTPGNGSNNGSTATPASAATSTPGATQTVAATPGTSPTVTSAQATTTPSLPIPVTGAVTGADFETNGQVGFILFTLAGAFLVGLGVALRRLAR